MWSRESSERGWWKLKQTWRRLKGTNLEGNETLGVLGSRGSGDILFCSKQRAKLSFTFSFTSLFMTRLPSLCAALHGTICKTSLQGFHSPLTRIIVLLSKQWETCITALRKTVQLLAVVHVSSSASACGGRKRRYKTVDGRSGGRGTTRIVVIDVKVGSFFTSLHLSSTRVTEVISLTIHPCSISTYPVCTVTGRVQTELGGEGRGGGGASIRTKSAVRCRDTRTHAIAITFWPG